MKTLLVGEIHPDAEKLLREKVELENVEELVGSFAEIEAIVLRTFTPLQQEQLERLPSLRYVVLCSVGTDNIDLEELQKRKITLIQVPGSNANSVAEHTLYLMLSLLREDTKTPFAELKGKSVGIIGFGHIGKLVAKKLAGFECKVIAFDIVEQDANVLNKLQTEMKDFDSVLREADIVTVHVPLTEHTQEMISATAFERMKWGSFFINTSRAEVVEEQGLIDDFKDGRFRGVALDVYSEKLAKELVGGNVILTNHVAALGEESFREQCVKPVKQFLKKL